MKELKFNINYLFHKREFYFAIFIAIFVNLIHVILCVNESIRIGAFYEKMHSGEYQFILYNPIVTLNALLIIVFPIVFSMIFADSNFLENKRKTANMLTMRINNKKNIFSRILLSIIVTFLICFFSFLFNYILLLLIYGSGNTITYYQETAFHLTLQPTWFLDNIRLSNPIIFILAINFFVSLMYGLLVAFSYIVSFFVKNKIVVYFIPLCFVILTELLFPLIGLGNISFIKCLKPFSQYSLLSYACCVGLIVIFSSILLIVYLKRKDTLI